MSGRVFQHKVSKMKNDQRSWVQQLITSALGDGQFRTEIEYIGGKWPGESVASDGCKSRRWSHQITSSESSLQRREPGQHYGFKKALVDINNINRVHEATMSAHR